MLSQSVLISIFPSAIVFSGVYCIGTYISKGLLHLAQYTFLETSVFLYCLLITLPGLTSCLERARSAPGHEGHDHAPEAARRRLAMGARDPVGREGLITPNDQHRSISTDSATVRRLTHRHRTSGSRRCLLR